VGRSVPQNVYFYKPHTFTKQYNNSAFLNSSQLTYSIFCEKTFLNAKVFGIYFFVLNRKVDLAIVFYLQVIIPRFYWFGSLEI